MKPRPVVAPPLIDAYGRLHDYLRISVTERCNMNCTYCRPGVVDGHCGQVETLSRMEIVRLVRVAAALGVTKVRLTGGEPTLRPDVERLIAEISCIPGIRTVAMTTNGLSFVQKAEAFKSAGLTSVNISLDSLDCENFARITGRNSRDRVLAAIETSIRLEFSPVKVNMVVIPRVNEHELCDLVEYARHRPICIRFIEHMPFKGNHWNEIGFVPSSEMRGWIEQHYQLHALTDNDSRGRVAQEFSMSGFQGTIGFVSPLSNNFCARCSRLRVTADGSLKTCLFHPSPVNLRNALRSGDDQLVERLIREAVRIKPPERPDLTTLRSSGDLSMIQIGG